MGLHFQEIYINKCYRLRSKVGIRPILLSLSCNWIKSLILTKRKMLSELGLSISIDRSKEVREAYKLALPTIINLKSRINI